jgi:hypothetical protein
MRKEKVKKRCKTCNRVIPKNKSGYCRLCYRVSEERKEQFKKWKEANKINQNANI